MHPYSVEKLFAEKQTRMRVACFRFNLDFAHRWRAKIRRKQGSSAQNGVFQQNKIKSSFWTYFKLRSSPSKIESSMKINSLLGSGLSR